MVNPARIYRRSELEAIKPAIDAEGCLYRYRKLWLEGVDDSSDVSLIGVSFHAVQHSYLLKLLDARLTQDQELAQEAFVEGTAAVQAPSRLLPQIREVWDWHAESFELDLDRFVAAEERGSTGQIGWTPDHVQAHPERNALEVVDYKSGWSPPLTEAELKVLFQARVYSRLAQERWPGFDAYEFTLVAVRFRKRVTVRFTPSELDAVDLEVRAAIATIGEAERADVWPATPGPSCHFCTLSCPVADQMVTLPKRLPLAQVKTLGAWLLVADKQLRAARKLMKAAVGIHGPQTVNGVIFSNCPVETRSYPIDAVLEVLRLRGIGGAFEGSAKEGLTISHSALNRLFKAYPGLEEDLAPVVQTKTGYRFAPRQPDAEAEEDE